MKSTVLCQVGDQVIAAECDSIVATELIALRQEVKELRERVKEQDDAIYDLNGWTFKKPN